MSYGTYDKDNGFELNKVYELKLLPDGFSRGRSAVVQHFIVKSINGKQVPKTKNSWEQISISFAAKGTDLLIKALVNQKLDCEKGRLYGKFMMKKQGQSLRWEPITDES